VLSPAARQLFVVLAATAAMLATFGAIHRAAPHDVMPGWTQAEWSNRLAQVNLGKDVVVIGDSRVGWGVADKILTRQLRRAGINITAHNLGFAGAGFAKIMDRLKARGPSQGLLVIAYSPAFLYDFDGGPELEADTDRIRPENTRERGFDAFFQSRIPTSPSVLWSDLKSLLHPTHQPYWRRRTVYAEGFVNADMVWRDGTPQQYQLDYYSRRIRAILDDLPKAAARRRQFVEAVRRLRSNGWHVITVRLPISPDLRKLEDTVPAELQLRRLATDCETAAVDYNDGNVDLTTIDNSHLTPSSARQFTSILASDLLRLYFDARRSGGRDGEAQ
jgi:hypothetical protein